VTGVLERRRDTTATTSTASVTIVRVQVTGARRC
jgi:hypothetical protein